MVHCHRRCSSSFFNLLSFFVEVVVGDGSGDGDGCGIIVLGDSVVDGEGDNVNIMITRMKMAVMTYE